MEVNHKACGKWNYKGIRVKDVKAGKKLVYVTCPKCQRKVNIAEG